MVKKKINEADQAEKKISVLIADDHPIVRQSLKALINTQEDMEVIAEASNGREAVKLSEELLPDIIIMDIGMPEMNGLEATRLIKSKQPEIAILVLTVHTGTEYVLGILEAGAAGYLTKTVLGMDIVHAIRATIAGEAVLTPSILNEFVMYTSRGNLKPAKTDLELSAKELFLLKLAARGMNNKQIAGELNFTENTVKRYLTELFIKMNVSSRTEAVVKGLKDGIISFSDLDE
jgi:two-component system, NarL family, response regulator LiaR